MKKLTLDLEALAVESFDTVPLARRGDGTVRGHDSLESPSVELPNGGTAGTDSCDSCDDGTQYYTCENSAMNNCVPGTHVCYYGSGAPSCGPAGSCSVGCYVG